MITLQIDVSVSNRGNDAAVSFLGAKSAINTFFTLIARMLERIAGLILRTGRQSGGKSLDDNEPEIWKLDKFHKLDITQYTY